MNSPFKFLDSYTKEDRNIFFGRDREIEELYHRVFESKLMLVYGVSGTGKSSLINCGLANKFQETDWLPIEVRRSNNIVESTVASIKAASITPQEVEFRDPQDFRKGVRSLYLDYYKPVFFIFDQFEELFIFGDREERTEFIHIVKSLIDSDLQCRLIFVMREEYMAGVTEFEKYIPSFFSNRVRIEKMSHANAVQAIEQPCKTCNISLEQGFAESLLERLSPEGASVELTYLQVYLDKIFRMSQSASRNSSDLSFDISLLQQIGNVSDLLGNFLDEQISLMESPEKGLTVLKSFVSIKGTKRQMSREEVQDYARSLGRPVEENELHGILQNFIQLRILKDKDQNEKYELRHDALAAKVFEKITLVEKELLEIRNLVENAFHNWQKRGVLLSASDLEYIAPYESRLFLPDEQIKLIEKSKYELVKNRLRRRRVFTAAGIVLIVILGGFTFWALKERKNAIIKEKVANEERMKANASEKEAIQARDIAIESDRKAMAAEQKAIEERDRAEASELRTKREKELAVMRERQTRASNYNWLSKEVVTDDPTIALRLAEYALSLDPDNRTILSNLRNIYYNHPQYRVFLAYGAGNRCKISHDWETIVTAHGRSARVSGLRGEGTHILIGHLVSGFPRNAVHNFARSGFDDILDIAFSLDGRYVLTGSNDRTARLWDAHGNCIQVFRGHALFVRSVSFSPDGNTILTGSGDLTARLWNLKGECLQVFTGHKNWILSAVFSPDGNSVLTGSSDSTAILWDLNGNILQQFTGHTGAVRSVGFSHDGQWILTGSYDQTARLWDIEGSEIQVFTGHTGVVISAVFSPDDNLILTGSTDKTARLWDVHGNTIQVLKGHTGTVYSATFSPDSDSILTFCYDGIARKWDVSKSVFKDFTGHNDAVREALFSPDGKTILTMSNDQIRLWDLVGIPQKTIKLLSNSVTFSPDGLSILVGMGAIAQLRDLDGNLVKTFIGHRGGRLSVAFSPDGQTILTGSQDKTARLWNLDTETLAEFSAHSAAVNCVGFSPDGRTVVTGSSDHTARLWDLNGHTLQEFKGHSAGINSIAFSPDGQSLLTGSDDQSARLWDLHGNTLQVFQGHTGTVNSIAFSPDGRVILTGSSDKTARTWDLKGNTLQIFNGYKTSVWSAAFSPDGRSILTGSGDQIARLSSLKMPMERFMEENLSEELSLGQKLYYEILGISQAEKEKEISHLFEGLGYCISQAQLDNENRDDFLDHAVNLIRKIGNNITEIYQGEQFIARGLEIFRIRPEDYMLRKVEEINDMFLSFTGREEMKRVYDCYSEQCSETDSAVLAFNLPGCLIRAAESLLSLDTSVRKTISLDLAALTWPLIQSGQYESSLTAAMLALEADSTNEYLYSTLPLVFLLNGRFDEASSIYRKYEDKAMFDYLLGSYRTIFLEDIANLESKGITHPDFARVKAFLKD